MMHESDAAPQRIALIGAPIEVGTHEPGALMGPAALRTAGLVRTLRDLGHAVEDRGDIAPAGLAPGATGLPAVAAWAQALSEAVEAALDEGAVPLAAGAITACRSAPSMGPCAIAPHRAAAHGAVARRPCRLQHPGDLALRQRPRDAPGGALRRARLFTALFRQPAPPPLDPRRVHLFGLRSVDAGERALVRARKVGVTDMREIDEFGVVAPPAPAAGTGGRGGRHLHVSFDIDFLDPSIAPAVGTAVPGGATFREAHLIMEMLHDCGLVGSLDVVELNPFLDERGRSARVLVELVASLFGRRILDRPSRRSRCLRRQGAGGAMHTEQAIGAPSRQRSVGTIRLAVGPSGEGGPTRLRDLAESGPSRLRFPRVGDVPEAVLVNTAGGIACGDVFHVDLDLAGAATSSSPPRRRRRSTDRTGRTA